MRKFRFVLVLLACSAVLFFYRHAILSAGFEWALTRATHLPLHYDTKEWRDGTLRYTNLALGEGVVAEGVELSFHWKEMFYFEGHIRLQAPQITIDPNSPDTLFHPALLLPAKYGRLRLDVAEGVVAIEDRSFAFEFVSSEEDIGLLTVEREEVTCHLFVENDLIHAAFNIAPMEVRHLLDLQAVAHPLWSAGWEEVEGVVAVHGESIFDSGFSLQEARAMVHLHDVRLINPTQEIALAAKACEMNLSWPSVVDVTVASGSLTYKAWNATDLTVDLHLQDGLFTHTTIRGEIEKIAAQITLEGVPEICEIGYQLAAPLHVWLQKPATESPLVQLTGKATRGEEGYACEGSFLLPQEIEFGAIIAHDGRWQTGWLRSEALTEEAITPVLQLFDIPYRFTGHISLLADIGRESLTATIGGQAITAIFNDLSCQLPAALGQLSYTLATQQLAFDLPLQEASATYQGITLHNIAGTLHGEEDHLLLQKITAVCSGLSLGASADITLGVHPSLHAHLHSIQGRLENLLALAAIDGPLTGELRNGSVEILVREESIDWSGEAALAEVFFEKDVQNGRCHLAFDSTTGLWRATDVQADLALYPVTISAQEVLYTAEKTGSFDFRALGKGATPFDVTGEGSFAIAETLTFALQAPQTPLGRLELRGEKRQEEWTIDELSLGELQGKLLFSFTGGTFVSPAWEGRWKESTARGDARWEGDKLFVHLLDLSHLGPYHLRGESEMAIAFTPALQIQNISLVAYEEQKIAGTFRCPAFTYRDKKWEAEPATATITLLPEPLVATLTVRAASDACTFQGVVERGNITFGEQKLVLKQVAGLTDYTNVQLRGQALFRDLPLQLAGKFPLDLSSGTVLVQNGSDGLTATFCQPFVCQEIDGRLSGLFLHLKRDPKQESYTGFVKIERGADAARLVDIPEVDNVEFVGTWKKGSFSGEMRGHDVVYRENIVDEIQAKVEWLENQATVRDLSLCDQAGTLTIKQIHCTKREAWHFTIPLIKGQNLRPSLLRKTDKPLGEPKPLLIRNLVLTDVRGTFGKPLSLHGRGSCNFTNAVREEASFFSVPLEMLKNLGLDLGLFTPVTGEASYFIKEGKIYLTALTNTFSEGARSEFHIASDFPPSYIDLDGNIAINLRVRQDVVLKFAEPFALTIRGNLENPSYALAR